MAIAVPAASELLVTVVPSANTQALQNESVKIKYLDIVLSIVCGSYIGVAVRVALTSLTTNYLSSDALNSLGPASILPNIVGCFVMGIFLKTSSVNSINTGIKTGFCGSCTTFSTWIVFISDSYVEENYTDATLALLVGFFMSFIAFRAGIAAASCINEKFAEVTTCTLCIVTLLLSTVVWLLAAGVLDSSSRQSKWSAIALGPPGALIRYALSLRNKKTYSFPIFTFVPNYIASVLATVIKESADSNNIWMTGGIAIGTLGSLSTVSTWVSELYQMEKKQATLYAILTIIPSVITCTVILLL